MQQPATWYQPSPRPYPSVLADPVYPADASIRRVRYSGQIKWRGHLVFVSEPLAGEAVGIVETLVGYEVYFGPVLLGRIDPRGERLIRSDEPIHHRGTVTHAPS